MGRTRIEIGQAGEEIAETYLLEQGYQVVARNYRTRHGEIDRIVRHANDLVFVEVKTRRSLAYGMPAESITWKKQQKLRQTALSFLQEYGYSGIKLRFDVVSIILPDAVGKETQIEHLRSAF